MAIAGLLSAMAAEAAPMMGRKLFDFAGSALQGKVETEVVGRAANFMGRASTSYGATAGRALKQAHGQYGKVSDMQTVAGLGNDLEVAVSKNFLKSPSVKSPSKLKSPIQKTASIKTDNPVNGAIGSLNRLNPNPIFNPIKARARQSLSF